jgi:preprotein translocase subunit SecF
LLVIASIVAVSIWGLKLGIEFTGGVLMEMKFDGETPSNNDISGSLSELNLNSLTIQPSEDNTVLVRFSSDEDVVNEQVKSRLKESFEGSSIERMEFIGSTVSNELKSRAFMAVFFAIIGIAAYIAWAFRKTRYPIESWKYGVAAVIALAHDTLITIGIFAYLGKFHGIEVGIPFVAALLTILGYSVNDTIVVFDRIRENLNRSGAKDDFEKTINESINETLGRSINTSLTVVIVLLSIFFLGGVSIKYFALAMLIGIIFGTYSSIFVASALLVEAWKSMKKG